MQCRRRLRHRTDVGLPRVYQRTIFLWSHPQVLDPFVIPGGFERARCHLSNGCRRVRPTKGAKALLCLRAYVRVAWIRRRAQSCEDEKCDEVALIKHIHMRVGGKVTATTQISEG